MNFFDTSKLPLGSYKKNKAFTLIELLVVIAIISLLSSVVLASLASARASARDARRLADMRQIMTALEMYYNDHGYYPEENSSDGSWERSYEDGGEFIDVLVDDGYLSNYIVDPLNEGTYRYRYYRYPSNYEGCDDPFYVLGVKDMESVDSAHPDSPGWACPTRDWQPEAEWTTGRFE